MSAAASGSIDNRPVRPSMDREPLGFRLLALASALLAVALVVSTFIVDPNAIRVIGPSALLWALAVAIAGVFPLRLSSEVHLSMDLPVLLAAGMLYGPGPAALLGFVAFLDIREVRREVSLWNSVFNRSQTALAAGMAGLCFLAVGGQLGRWPGALAAAVLALLIDVVINMSLVAVSVWTRTGRPLRRVLPAMVIGSPVRHAISYACFGLSSLFLAELVFRIGPVGLAAVAIPIVVLGHETFASGKGIAELTGVLRVRNAALARVDDRIAQERRDERQRIAEALHDDVLQSLYGVTLRTHVLREDLRSGQLLALDDDVPGILEAAEGAVDELRGIIRDLRRSTVGAAGLVGTVLLLSNHLYEESGVQIVGDLDGSVQLDPETELLLYQIAKEAMQNATRHAMCSTVWVSLKQASDLVTLEVSDDGRGFDQDRPLDEMHFGLELMRTRAQSLGAELSITSTPGHGTSVRVHLKTP